jgi:hypothetical protein
VGDRLGAQVLELLSTFVLGLYWKYCMRELPLPQPVRPIPTIKERLAGVVCALTVVIPDSTNRTVNNRFFMAGYSGLYGYQINVLL